jgi:hypothetical protein
MSEQPELLFAGVGRTVAAMDRFTGRPVWRVKLPRILGGNITMVLPHANELYVGRGGYVYCLDQGTGSVLWERGMNASGGMLVMAVSGADADAQQQSAAAHQAAAQQAAMVGASAAAAAAAAAAS